MPITSQSTDKLASDVLAAAHTLVSKLGHVIFLAVGMSIMHHERVRFSERLAAPTAEKVSHVVVLAQRVDRFLHAVS